MVIEGILQQALNHHTEQRFVEAEQLYHAILSSEPSAADANFNLGVLSVQTDRALHSLHLFAAAVAASPERDDFWDTYIEVLDLCGESAKARDIREQKNGRQQSRAPSALAAAHVETPSAGQGSPGDHAIAALTQALESESQARKAELAALTDALSAEINARQNETARLNQYIATLEHNRAQDAELLDALLPDALNALFARAPDVPRELAAKPRVSVIMPVRNRPEQVRWSLASLQAQTLADWEVIVVSDGSTDRTVEVIEEIAASDARIRLFQLPPSGVSAARNHGLAQARGDIIAYLDSDNRAFPDYLAHLTRAFDASPQLQSAYGALVSDAAHARGKRVLWQAWDRAAMLYNNFIDLNVFAHRRSLYEELGGFDLQLTRLVDWDLILRYTAKQAPLRLPVVGTSYSTGGADRITRRPGFGRNRFLIRRKWQAKAACGPRVLYLFERTAQAREASVAIELAAMRRLGADIGIWSADAQNGTLDLAIDTQRPAVIHVTDPAMLSAAVVAARRRNIRVSVRPHRAGDLHAALANSGALDGTVYAEVFTTQMVPLPAAPWLHATPAVFDSELFAPLAVSHDTKDARLVMHAAVVTSHAPEQQLALLLETARRLPGHRFALALTLVNPTVPLTALRAKIAQMGAQVEIHLNPSHREIAALMVRSSWYLYQISPGDDLSVALGSGATAIAEAMACGTLPLVPNIVALNEYAGPASLSYTSVDELVNRITQSTSWSDEVWQEHRAFVSDRAFERHTDEVGLRPLFDTWCQFASQSAS